MYIIVDVEKQFRMARIILSFIHYRKCCIYKLTKLPYWNYDVDPSTHMKVQLEMSTPSVRLMKSPVDIVPHCLTVIP